MILERRKEAERRQLRREQALLRTQLNFTLTALHQPKLAADALTIEMIDNDPGTPKRREPRAGSFEQLLTLFGSPDGTFQA